MRQRVLIVGGGYAGVLCAARLARKTKAEIALVDPRAYFVERVRLHQDVSGGLRKRRPLSELAGVTTWQGTVREVDFDNRRVRLDDREEAFDELVIATGSVARRESNAYALGTDEDAQILAKKLGEQPNAHVLIVGGGLTGIELATELRHRVTLVTEGEVAPGLGPIARAHIRRALPSLIEHRRVVAYEPDGVILDDGQHLAADIVVVCTGLVPTPLPAGLALAPDGRALVDDHLRSVSHSFVHVIGDAAASGLRMACATANPMGAYAADDIARPNGPFRFAFALQCLSLGRRDAVVQLMTAADRPKRFVLRGRPAAWFKEFLCRYAVGAAPLERAHVPYMWPQS